MEREQYQNQIKDLLQAVETLLKSNKAMGEKLDKTTAAYEDLKAKYEKLEGELAMRKRGQHGKRSEKPKDTSGANPASDGSKEDDEDKYIENGSRNEEPADDEEQEEDTAPVVPQEKKLRDLSNRPDHYNTMHADICVIHDCDLDRLKEMGLEFIRYTRPVDQFDRVSVTRQDRYLYVWVRDKNGNEYPFFIPKSREDEKRECVFVNESKYDMPRLVPHTSATYSMLSDLGVNRFQYALSSGREMYRMFNEKMCMSKQSILLHRTEAEVLDARKTESIPILNELNQRAMALLAKIKSKEVTVSSKLEQALNYMHNNWKELIAYIDVGSVLIDNNCCERAVRPFTNLRKSFGGFSSEKGGEVAAAWLTFIETCKLQKKAALDFFQEFFKKITEGRVDYELVAQEVLG